jgi:hypothetical protein
MTMVQLSYTLVELGLMLGKDPRTVARWLKGKGVPISHVGRDPVVWLADLAHHIPEFERSLTIKSEFDQAG